MTQNSSRRPSRRPWAELSRFWKISMALGVAGMPLLLLVGVGDDASFAVLAGLLLLVWVYVGLVRPLEERSSELERSERKYHNLLDQAGLAIIAWDPVSFTITEANTVAGTLCGIPAQALLGRQIDGLFAEQDRAQLLTTLKLIPFQGAVHLEYLELHNAKRGGFPVELSAAPVQLEEGALVLGMLRDITESQELERRETLINDKIHRSERMASIGQLAAGIAHEINNPMSYVSSNASRLADYTTRLADLVNEMEGPSTSEMRELLDDLEEMATETCEGVARVTEIVNALREFSHGGSNSEGFEWIDVNRVIQNCITLIRNQIESSAEIHMELQELPSVFAHPTQIGQVIMNLVVNAAHSMDGTGTILITTVGTEKHVHIVVEDNGSGIPAEKLPRIFDPFFTTKSVGQGTGLGLSVSQQIIQRHGGQIWVDSLEGQGTRFLVELPREGPPEPKDDEDPPTFPPRNDPTAW